MPSPPIVMSFSLLVLFDVKISYKYIKMLLYGMDYDLFFGWPFSVLMIFVAMIYRFFYVLCALRRHRCRCRCHCRRCGFWSFHAMNSLIVARKKFKKFSFLHTCPCFYFVLDFFFAQLILLLIIFPFFFGG